jgi:hypothetical protein
MFGTTVIWTSSSLALRQAVNKQTPEFGPTVPMVVIQLAATTLVVLSAFLSLGRISDPGVTSMNNF